ncbi:unnamed protein product [Symbiodinium microadriaticum]|nr:unnamed protein product [Symbiodinium microadriaticum]
MEVGKFIHKQCRPVVVELSVARVLPSPFPESNRGSSRLIYEGRVKSLSCM